MLHGFAMWVIIMNNLSESWEKCHNQKSRLYPSSSPNFYHPLLFEVPGAKKALNPSLIQITNHALKQKQGKSYSWCQCQWLGPIQSCVDLLLVHAMCNESDDQCDELDLSIMLFLPLTMLHENPIKWELEPETDHLVGIYIPLKLSQPPWSCLNVLEAQPHYVFLYFTASGVRSSNSHIFVSLISRINASTAYEVMPIGMHE